MGAKKQTKISGATQANANSYIIIGLGKGIQLWTLLAMDEDGEVRGIQQNNTERVEKISENGQIADPF